MPNIPPDPSPKRGIRVTRDPGDGDGEAYTELATFHVQPLEEHDPADELETEMIAGGYGATAQTDAYGSVPESMIATEMLQTVWPAWKSAGSEAPTAAQSPQAPSRGSGWQSPPTKTRSTGDPSNNVEYAALVRQTRLALGTAFLGLAIALVLLLWRIFSSAS